MTGLITTILVAGRDRPRLSEIVQVASWFELRVSLAQLGLERGPVDAPRLVRAAVRRLEANPAEPMQNDPAAAILTVGRWIAAALLVAAGIIAVALFLA